MDEKNTAHLLQIIETAEQSGNFLHALRPHLPPKEQRIIDALEKVQELCDMIEEIKRM